MKIWGLCFIGFGNVGQGLARILVREEEELYRKWGFKFKTLAVVGRTKGACKNPEGISLQALLNRLDRGESIGTDLISPLEAVRLSGVDIVIDVTPTNLTTGEPGLSITRAALNEGKHVISSNKGPVSLAFHELQKLASDKRCEYRFEGTVMSGTPAINLALESMAGCEFYEIQGIVNGTTNYILTRMEEGLEYDVALKEAQDLGYAETNPEGDVDGWDAAVKAQIIANVIMRNTIPLSKVTRKGIAGLSRKNIQAAKSKGAKIKLLAHIQRTSDGVLASVAPVELPLSHPLAGVDGATNAITYTTNNIKNVTIIGPGAGREETGQALLSDMLSIVAHEQVLF